MGAELRAEWEGRENGVDFRPYVVYFLHIVVGNNSIWIW